MDTDTERPDEYDAEAYWRRRVYVLAGGIALIGLVAWACSGSGHKRSTAQVRNAAATVNPGAAATPTVTVTVTATPTAVPIPETKRAGDRCDDGDVVIGLTPTANVFPGKQHPRFGLSVVSTGPQACSFDVGGKSLQIRIASGSDRVWSSAKCGGGTGGNLQMLQRGVPYLATLDWNRKRCDGDDDAQPGTYVISVSAPGIKTKREVFRLR